MNARLILIRGLPGSGKSTLARQFVAKGYAHYEADMYFTDADGNYNYVPSQIKHAHEWCQRKTREALDAGGRVVVSNTFSQRWELEPYMCMTAHIQVIGCHGEWPNVHNVPAEAIERMRARWEAIDGETSADEVAA